MWLSIYVTFLYCHCIKCDLVSMSQFLFCHWFVSSGFCFPWLTFILTSWDWRKYYSLRESRFCRSDGGNVLIWRCVLDHYCLGFSLSLTALITMSLFSVSLTYNTQQYYCEKRNVITNIQYTAVLTLFIPYNTILIWWFLFLFWKRLK